MEDTYWKDAMKNGYPKTKTPKDLIRALKNNKYNAGYFMNNGFKIFYSITAEDEDSYVISTEKISKSGISAGGMYIINKHNMNQAVWD